MTRIVDQLSSIGQLQAETQNQLVDYVAELSVICGFAFINDDRLKYKYCSFFGLGS